MRRAENSLFFLRPPEDLLHFNRTSIQKYIQLCIDFYTRTTDDCSGWAGNGQRDERNHSATLHMRQCLCASRGAPTTSFWVEEGLNDGNA